MGSNIENSSASSVVCLPLALSLKKFVKCDYYDLKDLINQLRLSGEINFDLSDYDVIIITYFLSLFEKYKNLLNFIKTNYKCKIGFYFEDLMVISGDIMTYFDFFFLPLKEHYQQNAHLKNCYFLDYGVDTKLLNIDNKSKKPTLFIDYDRRRGKNADPSEILEACNIVRKQKDIHVILIEKESNLADECIINKIPFPEIYQKYNQSWLYITRICSTYELPVIESQMAGNFVVSVGNNVKGELFELDKTGFIVENNRNKIAELILDLIEKYNPNIPRNFALNRFNYEIICKKMVDIIQKTFGFLYP